MIFFGRRVAANMTVAATPRYYDRKAGQWADGDTLFMRVTAWRQMAENAAESLSKGDRVVVTGRLRQKPYETAERDKRTHLELRTDEADPSLRYAVVKLNRSLRPPTGTMWETSNRPADPSGHHGQ